MEQYAVEITVNGQALKAAVCAGDTLLEVLREQVRGAAT